jgi:hypothetical protein
VAVRNCGETYGAMHGLMKAHTLSALQRRPERRDVTEFSPLRFRGGGSMGVLDMLLLLGGPQESLRMRWGSGQGSFWLFATLQ